MLVRYVTDFDGTSFAVGASVYTNDLIIYLR